MAASIASRRGRLVQRAVQHQAPGNAGDAHQVGGRNGCHAHSSRYSPARLYPKSPRVDAERIAPSPIPATCAASRLHAVRDQGSGRMRISIILPAKNEAEGLRQTLPALRARLPEAEVIVVDDGSTDDTAAVAAGHGARVLSSPVLDGQRRGDQARRPRGHRRHPRIHGRRRPARPADIPQLLDKLEAGYDMVVGARDAGGQANVGRGAANALLQPAGQLDDRPPRSPT